MENWPLRLQTAAYFGLPFLVCGPLRLKLSHPPHALISVSLCFFLARSLVILASTMLDMKNMYLSGWQLVQCRRAVLLGDILMASIWAFLFSQESARTRVLHILFSTIFLSIEVTFCIKHQDFLSCRLNRCLLEKCGLKALASVCLLSPTIWFFFLPVSFMTNTWNSKNE